MDGGGSLDFYVGGLLIAVLVVIGLVEFRRRVMRLICLVSYLVMGGTGEGGSELSAFYPG